MKFGKINFVPWQTRPIFHVLQGKRIAQDDVAMRSLDHILWQHSLDVEHAVKSDNVSSTSYAEGKERFTASIVGHGTAPFIETTWLPFSKHLDKHSISNPPCSSGVPHCCWLGLLFLYVPLMAGVILDSRQVSCEHCGACADMSACLFAGDSFI